MDLTIALLALGFLVLLKLTSGKSRSRRNSNSVDVKGIKHKKREFLLTQNESKLLFALNKVLDNKYMIHCQTSVIALVDPVEFEHKKRAWSKRVDFVITDSRTRILAVIELDDASHNQPKRQERDAYLNAAMKPHHPLIRIPSRSFYEPKMLAELLQTKAGIQCRVQSDNPFRPNQNVASEKETASMN